MIIESIARVALGTLTSVLTTVGDVVQIPTQFISVLQTITGYGAWIVGGDLLAVIVATAFFWMSAKLIVGVLTYLWELLPLT